MPRGLSLLFSLFAVLSFGSVQTLPALPAGTFINAVQVDSAGNIYLAGQLYANLPAPSTGHAFVGKLSPDGSKVIWWTTLAGSSSDVIQAMALGPDNSAYVTGTTQSPDFPTTNGSMQPTTSVFAQAFAAKLSPAGAVVYATYIGGSNQTSGKAIAVDSAGHAYITGGTGYDGLFPTTSGAIAGATTPFNGVAFVMELNTSGSAAQVALTGFGGSAIAVDPQGNIYAAGAFSVPVPTTPGAFQSTFANATCSSGGPGSIGPGLCIYQHVAKISPDGTQLLFATYINGNYGATPSAIAVDSAGNVIVAGGTNSPDYPTTPGAYQPEYFANPGLEQVGPFITVAPYSAGYVTKLNATGIGSALVDASQRLRSRRQHRGAGFGLERKHPRLRPRRFRRLSRPVVDPGRNASAPRLGRVRRAPESRWSDALANTVSPRQREHHRHRCPRRRLSGSHGLQCGQPDRRIARTRVRYDPFRRPGGRNLRHRRQRKARQRRARPVVDPLRHESGGG